MYLSLFQGAGFYVAEGVPIDTLPNNGLVRADNGNDVSLRCASGTLSPRAEDSQEIIGLEDTDITSVSSDSFIVDQDSGFIRIITSNLRSDEQGVYTCRILDEENNLVEVNVGIYSNGFNSEYCINQPIYGELYITHQSVVWIA